MKRFRQGLVVFIGMIPVMAAADIPIENLRGEAYADIGQIVKGQDEKQGEFEGQYLNRLGVTITAIDTVKEKLALNFGVGGLFWQPFPNYAAEFWKTNVHFGPGITEMSAKFLFNSSWSLQGGYFPFKYGSSMDLGEYLLRSESYPAYVQTGGWTWVDSAFIRTMGLRLQGDHFGGKFHHELGLYMEFATPPLFDFTPAYIFSWKPVTGLTLGGAFALRRWFEPFISFQHNPKALSAQQYVELQNFPEINNLALVTFTDAAGGSTPYTYYVDWRYGADITTADSLNGRAGLQILKVDTVQLGGPAGPRKGIKKFLMNARTDCQPDISTQGKTCTYYLDTLDRLAQVDPTTGNIIPGAYDQPVYTKNQTIQRRSIVLMGRMELDIAKMLGAEGSMGPFSLYGEAAVLGVQNQPVYYQKISERIPIMLGARVPTFGLLDLLAVETEYFNNPYRDSEDLLNGYQYADYNPDLIGANLPIPDLGQDEYFRQDFHKPSEHSDDWKWSVHAVKTLVPGVKLKLQAANDHLRLNDYEALPSKTPRTLAPDHWYYLVHLQWGF